MPLPNRDLSGRYAFNGGADLAARAAAREGSAVGLVPGEPSLTLAIDIDGPEPGNAVSCTLVADAANEDEKPVHFIAQVTVANGAQGPRIRATNVSFVWPGSGDRVEGLEIQVHGGGPGAPTASVTFHDAAGVLLRGPYKAPRVSSYFRTVEIDLDSESGSEPIPGINTHVHPRRPPTLENEDLTLESVFARAGVEVVQSTGSGTVVDTSAAGTDAVWEAHELHDSMYKHWEGARAADLRQWKMWVFKANRYIDAKMGGLMFDSRILEDGGHDRQGTAIFTKCRAFFDVNSAYVIANPPRREHVARDLFFTLVHETAHAFNLDHSFLKTDEPWDAPAWSPITNNPKAISWMNYPNLATKAAGGPDNSTRWFYERFGYCFDEHELLFLRHAPEGYVQMGNAAFGTDHARVAPESIDNRLSLVLRNLRTTLEFGEPVLLELRLKNTGPEAVLVHDLLDPSAGWVQIAITNPEGVRRPFIPIDYADMAVEPRLLTNDERGIYQLIDLTMGKLGFPFKLPGPYLIEATYHNLDGTTAKATYQINVRPAASREAAAAVRMLHHAEVGSVLYYDGTRVLEEANQRLVRVRRLLDELIGPANPISMHLATVRYKALARDSKVALPASDTVEIRERDPESVVRELGPMLIERIEQAAATMGHIWFKEVADIFTECALECHKEEQGRTVQESMLNMFESRNVVPSITDGIKDLLRTRF